MNLKLERMQLLKAALASIGSGRGVSASVVLALRTGGKAERRVARMMLLGFPPRASMGSIIADRGRELGMLASLIAMASSSNTATVGRKGSSLAILLERWLKAGEERLMEARIYQMRGLLMSAVLGAVMATLSALGPIVASSGLFSQDSTASGPALHYAAAAMVAVSSSLLGLFLSGRRFYLNLTVALGVFLVAFSATSPLASVPIIGVWGAK